MLKLYKTLFIVVLKGLMVLGKQWSHETSSHRAFEASIFMGVLVLVNALVLLPDITNGAYALIFLAGFGISGFYFLPKKRYLGFLKEYQGYKYKTLFSSVAIIYIVLTLLSMIYYAYLI